MKKRIAVVGAGLLIYMSAAALAAHIALPFGMKRWVLIGILWLLGLIAAAAIVWFLDRKEKEKHAAEEAKAEPAAGAESAELEGLVRQAEAKLAAAKAGKIATLPAIFVLGEPGTTKTTTVLHCGLEPELLAGQVYQANDVVPTPLANLWLAGRIVVAEIGGGTMNDTGKWARIIRRLQPAKSVVSAGGQAPRAVLVCVDVETFAGGGSLDVAVNAARKLRQKLGEISEKLGINLPVYALFTRMDRIPFFLEFVRNLSNDDVRQVLGASLPLSTSVRGPGYTEYETNRLNQAFDDLTRSLCDARPELLSREHDAPLLPAVYEFPREFRKFRSSLVPFLLELCRPSQLTVGPFLRGFYFSGIRPIIVNEAAPAPRPVERPQDSLEAEIGATRMMKIGMARQQMQQAAAAQQVAGSRKVPQWVFLGHLFERVLLQDRLAMGASGASTKTSSLRRFLLMTAAVLCLIFATGWTISFFKNRGLVSDVREASAASAVTQPAGLALPSMASMQGLESLRQTLATLSDHQRYGAPFFYRWGLYVGDDLYPKVYSLYFARFKQVLFGETQNGLVDTLRRLPPTPGPDYTPTYNTLKAYLITTSNHDKSTKEFLAPVLLDRWAEGRNVDVPRMDLARKQFEFYSDELRYANPYSNDNDAAAIGKARAYLKQFGAFESIYHAMLADAAKAGPPINFNRKFPESAEVVLGPYDVSAAFTKPGFAFMKTALQNPEKYFAGEKWVLGEQSLADVDRSKLAVQLTEKYYSDYVKEWRNYLNRSSVPRFASVPDAAKKLSSISGNTSPLLALFWLASQNIPADVPEIATPLSPILTVVPASSDRYIAPPNQGYMTSMLQLQASVEAASQQPRIDPTVAAPVQNNAMSAKLAVRNLAQAFRPDPDGRLDSKSQSLLEDPIISVEGLFRNPELPAMNAAAGGTCQAMAGLWSKYPFNSAARSEATVAEVNSVFKKPEGAVWKLEAAVQKILTKQGNQYVPVQGGIAVSPAFVAFFNQAVTLADSFYAGGSDFPHFLYSLKPLPTTGMPTMAINLTLDGQEMKYAGGAAPAQRFEWKGEEKAAHSVRATIRLVDTADWITSQGLWAIFHFFDQADRVKSAEGGQILEWDIRGGREILRVNNENVTVRIQVDMGGAPLYFQKGYFNRIKCVPEVGK